jgi:hypothetical protein
MVVNYKDTWLKIPGSFIIAHFIEMIGQSESVWELLLQTSYYVEVGSGFLIAFIVWECVGRATKWLDKKYDWVSWPFKRALFQVGMAVVLPALVTYLLVNLQFRFVFQKNILDGQWLLYEFPVVVVFIVMINIFYVGYYFFERWRYSESLLQARLVTEPVLTIPSAEANEEPRHDDREFMLVRKGAKVFPLEEKDVALVYKDSTFNYVKTFAEQAYIIDRSLDEIENYLSPANFFRTNRQTIVNLKSIESYAPIENGKLKINLKLPSLPIVVSQKRAPYFRSWMKGKS